MSLTGTVDVAYEGRFQSMRQTIRDLTEEVENLRAVTEDLPGLYDEIMQREADIELLSNQGGERARKVYELLQVNDGLTDALEAVCGASTLDEAKALACAALKS
jgi:chromosome segregation ATPase